MTQPLATDIAALLSLIGRHSPDPTLSAHDRRAVQRMIGDDPNPLRAAAIVARAIGASHLVVADKLLKACIEDRLVGLRGLTSSDLDIVSAEHFDEEWTEVHWMDGPSVKSAREALAPLFQCGLAEDFASSSRSRGIDPDGHVIERFNGAARPAFYTISFCHSADRVVLSRKLTMSTRARCTAALARARSAGRLPADIEVVPTDTGFTYRHVAEDRIRAAIDDIVDDVVAGVDSTAA